MLIPVLQKSKRRRVMPSNIRTCGQSWSEACLLRVSNDQYAESPNDQLMSLLQQYPSTPYSFVEIIPVSSFYRMWRIDEENCEWSHVIGTLRTVPKGKPRRFRSPPREYGSTPTRPEVTKSGRDGLNKLVIRICDEIEVAFNHFGLAAVFVVTA